MGTRQKGSQDEGGTLNTCRLRLLALHDWLCTVRVCREDLFEKA